MDRATGSTEIGRQVRRLRRERGISAGTLAKRVGVTENAIRKLESGDSQEPRFSTGLRIARALQVEPREILGKKGAAYLFLDGSQRPEVDTIVRTIRAKQRALRKEGVAHLSLFGSVARGNAAPDSDIDVIIEPLPSAKFSLFDLAGVSEILRHALGRDVDVVTKKSLSESSIRAIAERDSVRVF